MASKSIDNLSLQVRYDDVADVLYISFGDPRPGIAVEVNDGDLVRVDPFTDAVVGITLLDFKARYVPSASMSIEESAQKIVPEILNVFKN